MINITRDSLSKLFSYCKGQNWTGYDPFDALNSPFLKKFSLDRKFLRIACIQLLKRLAFNVRPILGIKKGYNPKGIGLFLNGYANLYKLEKKPEYLEKIYFFLGLLCDLRSKGYSGNCWGYNFDWQSRAFYLPRYTPTIVNSSFIGHALLDLYRNTNIETALEMAVSIKDFILNDLNRKVENSDICFSYSPVDKSFVHNANLLGASLLIRLDKYVNDTRLRDTAASALAYSMKYQRNDGSWYYAETGFQKWIDSFHTGFNLQSIEYFLKEGFADKYRNEFKKGVNFYRNNFFLEDGTPKYYPNRVYPLDIHSAAQAVIFFSKMGSEYKELAEKIIVWMITNMQDEEGYFYYQKRRFCKIKIPYMRWSQAWTFLALSTYLRSYEK